MEHEDVSSAAAPVRNVVDDAPNVEVDAPLFSPLQVGFAALFGTPVAAGLLWFFNSRALGAKRPWLGIVVGALMTLAPFGVGTWLRYLDGSEGTTFATVVLVLWSLGYGVASSLQLASASSTHPTRSWLVVLPTAIIIVIVMLQAENVLHVRGSVVPQPVDPENQQRSGNVVASYGRAVDERAAVAIVEALDHAGYGKEGLLRLHLAQQDGALAVRLRVPDASVVDAAKGVGHVVAVAVGACVAVDLVTPSEVRVAHGRSCP